VSNFPKAPKASKLQTIERGERKRIMDDSQPEGSYFPSWRRIFGTKEKEKEVKVRAAPLRRG